MVRIAAGGKDEGRCLSVAANPSRQEQEGASQLGNPFPIRLLRHRGRERVPWTPARAVGAGQIASGDKKRKSIVFPSPFS